ncbi:alkali metal cation/H+ antiporter Nha1 C terminus-domain-containing protein [Mariannaea sp. PMI_226]|nr:alkali metal cation/H+ antiporter Nha1 C terminus-domain-containing protein [Mariannaea sp. PMI_226]
MAWDHLDITKPHLVYIILGGFTSLFMLTSSFIKERMYIGEATVATLVGVIFGPHAANLINPLGWGSTDIITVEFSRIVLVVQCFAVGVELPKFYMEKHWRSVIYLLVPVMTFGWLIVSLFIWWMIPPLNWLESLVCAACVTATDPVLASSVVGKGKFAKRVPKHLRDLLSAESGCNDGMAFPFIYLSLYLIQYNQGASEVSFHFVVYVVLYECIFGAFYGFMIGYIARHGIKYAEQHDMIDRESFLVFYFVVALFCAGSGSILGVDDLLVGFAAGVGFSNDGWFGEKTEESHVSNVIDLLLNLTYFVYFGTIIPWEQFNSGVEGLKAWRLVVIAVFVIFFRRIPVMMALKPLIPDIKTWREALFAGHFGPIGVGAIFVAMLARAELEHEEPVPLSALPPENSPHFTLVYLVWPITCFLVVSSILVHGSSIAVFTLGKRINTLSLTMSYTAAPDDGPSWMNRLPRISSQSRSQAVSETSLDEYAKSPVFPGSTLAPPFLLRRQRDDDNNGNSRASSIMSRKRKGKKWDDGIGPGGPVSQSAIFPQRPPATEGTEVEADEKDVSPSRDNTDSTLASQEKPKQKYHENLEIDESPAESSRQPSPRRHIEVYDEGDNMVFENEDGDVIDVQPIPGHERFHIREKLTGHENIPDPTAGLPKAEADKFWSLGGFRRKMSEVYTVEMEKRKEKGKSERRHEPARAYQFGNTIIVEDEDGEVVKTYELPTQKTEAGEGSSDLLGTSLKYMGLGSLARPAASKSPEATAEEGEAGPAERVPTKTGWAGRRKSVAQEQAADDRYIRFKIAGVGQRMTKEDFLREMSKLDSRTRKEVVDQSTASQAIKRIATQDLPEVRPPQLVVPEADDDDDDEPPRGRRQRLAVSRSQESISPGRVPSNSKPSEEEPETAVERKRRLAVLASQSEEAETGETPAERKRREAALGFGGNSSGDDSDDEGDERVPPTRRGITFAESTRPGKKGKDNR